MKYGRPVKKAQYNYQKQEYLQNFIVRFKDNIL